MLGHAEKLKIPEIFLISFFAWILTNPYQGIWHDARVYLITAYQYFTPEAYLRDSWFSHGSQSDFSLFAAIYNILLKTFGVEKSAFFTSLFGGLIWMVGVVVITRVWFSKNVFLPLLIFAAFPLTYSYTATEILQLSESFATARPFSFGLGLLGFAAYLRNHRISAVILTILSISLHPLLGIWVLIAIVAHALNDRWLLSLLSLGCIFFIALLIFPPTFSGLQNMPELWRELVRETSVVVLAKDSNDLTLDRSLAWIALLLWAYRLSNSVYGRWYVIAALLASWALLLTIITSFYYTMPLIAQIQPWRVQWLMIIIAVLAGFDLLHQTNLSKTEKKSRLILLLTPVAAGTGVGLLSFLAWLAWSVTGFRRPLNAIKNWLSIETKTLSIQIVLFGLMMVALLTQVSPFQSIDNAVANNIEVSPYIRWFILVTVACFYLTWKTRWQANIIILFFIVLAFHIWDQRPATVVAKEKSFSMQDNMKAHAAGIKQGDVVYWPRSDALVWFELVTANYFGNLQAIGIVFSEENALRLYQRASFISKIMLQESTSNNISLLDLHNPQYHDVDPGPVEIKKLCQDPVLDHVISWQHPSDPAVATEFKTVHRKNTFWAYHCRYFR